MILLHCEGPKCEQTAVEDFEIDWWELRPRTTALRFGQDDSAHHFHNLECLRSWLLDARTP